MHSSHFVARSSAFSPPKLFARESDQRVVYSKLDKIPEKIGWIHISSIQMIIRSTFRERLNTPIDLAIVDNQIKNRGEAILGIFRGNLKHQNIKKEDRDTASSSQSME